MDATMDQRQRILILGAAGRDFHQFNTQYRNDTSVEVVGFTATQVCHAVWYNACTPTPPNGHGTTTAHPYTLSRTHYMIPTKQIPNIEGRQYPPSLAGASYPKGLPIWSEEALEAIITQHKVDRCILAYSDLDHSKLMHLGARCLAAGADYELPQPYKSMLPSRSVVDV